MGGKSCGVNVLLFWIRRENCSRTANRCSLLMASCRCWVMGYGVFVMEKERPFCRSSTISFVTSNEERLKTEFLVVGLMFLRWRGLGGEKALKCASFLRFVVSSDRMEICCTGCGWLLGYCCEMVPVREHLGIDRGESW